eukprot:scaffold8483_cov84-Skeletonema_marinoi.AAC.3
MARVDNPCCCMIGHPHLRCGCQRCTSASSIRSGSCVVTGAGFDPSVAWCCCMADSAVAWQHHLLSGIDHCSRYEVCN